MKLKDIIIILLTFSILLLFVGCSNTTDISKNNNIIDNQVNENINVELNDNNLNELGNELDEIDSLNKELSIDEDFDLDLS